MQPCLWTLLQQVGFQHWFMCPEMLIQSQNNLPQIKKLRRIFSHLLLQSLFLCTRPQPASLCSSLLYIDIKGQECFLFAGSSTRRINGRAFRQGGRCGLFTASQRLGSHFNLSRTSCLCLVCIEWTPPPVCTPPWVLPARWALTQSGLKDQDSSCSAAGAGHYGHVTSDTYVSDDVVKVKLLTGLWWSHCFVNRGRFNTQLMSLGWLTLPETEQLSSRCTFDLLEVHWNHWGLTSESSVSWFIYFLHWLSHI